MARFSFCRLAPFASPVACLPRVAPRSWAVPIDLDLDSECAPRGPGWFDSSWELECGLEVREGLPTDAKLHEWLMAALVRPGAGASVGLPAAS